MREGSLQGDHEFTLGEEGSEGGFLGVGKLLSGDMRAVRCKDGRW